MKVYCTVFGALMMILTSAVSLQSSEKSSRKIFAFPTQKVTLENGLDVIMIEMPAFKNVLSFNMLVLAGARNETEKGKTGFAHLFEHIMFRHKYNDVANGYDDAINRLGAFNNAWTWFDITYYHPVTFTANLESRNVRGGETIPGLLELEASRFTRLSFDKKIFQTEAGAVLGEYRKSATDPGLAMDEKLLELMYPNHSYGHTTIGYLKDVQEMPNHYEYAVWFYDTYYRPNNCVLVIAGDIKAQEILPKIRSAFGSWQPKPTPPVNVQDPVQVAEKRGHVEWNAEVPPRVNVAHKGPKFPAGSKETAVGMILPELLVSESAPLYRKLRFEKKTVSSLSMNAQSYEGFDPRPIECEARLYLEQFKQKGDAYIEEVVRDITEGLQDLKTFSSDPQAEKILETVKSKFKYDFLASMDSPASVAQTFAWYYRFERDPEVLDKLIATIEQLTPNDIDGFAARYFVETNRVVITMAPKR
jgi:zinc protease